MKPELGILAKKWSAVKELEFEAFIIFNFLV